MAGAAQSTTVKSAMRTLDIIEYVVAHGQGVVAQDIAGALAIPVSSLSYLLATLVERDYLRREGRRYFAGPGLDRLGAPRADLSIEERAAPLVRSIRVELNETCSFMILNGWQIEARVTEASAQALRYAIEVGQRKPLHSLAAGKAILAALPDSDLARYFAETDRPGFTGSTLTGEAELRAEIMRVRDQGFAEARDEDLPGTSGLACAILRHGHVEGAIAVAVPSVRFDDQLRERARSRLMNAARLLAE